MKKTKVYKVLVRFSNHELNRFEKFISSPYFNSNQKLLSLFRIIAKHIKNQNINPLPKDEIWHDINHQEKYDDTKFRKLCSDLLKLVEIYFAQVSFESSPNNQNDYLLKELIKRKEDKLYSSVINRSQLSLDRSNEKSSGYFYNKFALERNKFSLLTDFDKKLKRKKNQNAFNYDVISNNLDRFYIIEKLRFFLSANTIQKIRNEEHQFTFITEITAYLAKIDLSNDPALSLYYKSFLAFTAEDGAKYYFQLKDQIFSDLNTLPMDEARDIFEAVLNFCIRKVNTGVETYHSEALDLYKYALQSKVIFDSNDELSPTSYRNIVIFAIRQNELDWADDFIVKYSQFLQEKHRANAINFSKARVHMARKEFAKSIELLRDVEYEDLTYNINSKAIILTSFYELDEYDSMFYFINSYKAFLRRNKKITPKRKSSFLNFVNVISKLANLEKRDKKELNKIKIEIEEMDYLLNRKWLLEKVEELLT